jgi:Resolvase, N terminal domain
MAGKAFFDMLGVFAEFETNLHRERQVEGISAATARGVYKARKPSIEALKSCASAPGGKARPGGDRTPARHRPGERLSPARPAGCGLGKWGCRCRIGWASGGRALARDGGRARRLWG